MDDASVAADDADASVADATDATDVVVLQQHQHHHPMFISHNTELTTMQTVNIKSAKNKQHQVIALMKKQITFVLVGE